MSLVGESSVATCERQHLEHAQQQQQGVWATAETAEHQGPAVMRVPPMPFLQL